MIIFSFRFALFIVELFLGSALFMHSSDWQSRSRIGSWIRFLPIVLLILLYSFAPTLNPYTLTSGVSTYTSFTASLGGSLYYVCTAVLVMAALYAASSMSWLKTLVVVACGYSVQHVASNAYTALLRALGERILQM